jgi:hypothetical protein
MALIVVVAARATGAVYLIEEEVGAEPSIV